MIPHNKIDSILADVDIADSGAGSVVALAHGAGGGVRENFGALINGIDDHRFVGPYYPGAGGTPLPQRPLDLDTLADQVVAAGLRAGGDRFPVIGLSLGAAVATVAAARHPEHVSALVVTIGVARQDRQIAAFCALWLALAQHEEWDALAQLMLYTTQTAEQLAGLSADEAADFRESVIAGYPRGGAAHARLAQTVDVTSLFPHIAVPTLVVVSGKDRIVLPETARAFSGISGSQVIEYPEAGHMFTSVEAQRWATDVADFLSRA